MVASATDNNLSEGTFLKKLQYTYLSQSTTDDRFTTVNRVSGIGHPLVGNFTVDVVMDKLQTASLEVRSSIASSRVSLGSGLETNKS